MNKKIGLLSMILLAVLIVLFRGCRYHEPSKKIGHSDVTPSFQLTPSDTYYFKSFADCNITDVRIGEPRKEQIPVDEYC